MEPFSGVTQIEALKNLLDPEVSLENKRLIIDELLNC
jgi:hypothetical protein